MKKTFLKKCAVLTAASALLGTVFVTTGCEYLQSSLSTEMQSKLDEETGTASIASKVWYYNGIASEDVSLLATTASDVYENQSILINFGKKVALGSLSGSIEVVYTDADGCVATKTFSTISGAFTEDYTGYKINLSDVVKLFDTVTIPSGTASMNLKVGGFKCAEGEQSGRAIASLEVKNIQIKPLFTAYTVDYSVLGFDQTCVIEYETSGVCSFDTEDGTEEISAKGSDGNTYKFTASVDNSASTSKILLKPVAKADDDASNFDFSDIEALKNTLNAVSVPVTLKNVLAVTGGDSFNREITLNFSKYSIIIDGKKDANFDADNVVVFADASGDSAAFAENYPSYADTISQGIDIQKVYITSDEDYLYVGVSGNMAITWNDALNLMISNGSVKGGNGARSDYVSAGTEDFANNGGRTAKIQPNVYITHKPGNENSGSGLISAYAYVDSTNTDISSVVKYAPAGWTNTESVSYVEYAIPLAGTGLAAGDTVHVIVSATLHWGEGDAVCDCASDDCITYNDGDHTSVTYKFADGIEYVIK